MPQNKKNRTKQRTPRPLGPTGEPIHAANALTIAWLLTVVTTLICTLLALAGRWYAATNPQNDRAPAMAELVLIASLIVGVISLVLLPIVWKVRPDPPPLPVTIFAALVGLAPLALLLLH